MEIYEKMREQFGGEPFINIGDEACCFFCPASIHLIKLFQRFPLLYSAVIEGVKCAEHGYYAAGIFVFSQLLQQYNSEVPKERHKVAHEFLKKQPIKNDYEKVRNLFIKKAKDKMLKEFSNYEVKGLNYNESFYKEWKKLYETRMPSLTKIQKPMKHL